MVTPYYSTFALELFHKQGRENTQPVEMWQKGGFSPHKSASTEGIEIPRR
jgi:hypothetical protein